MNKTNLELDIRTLTDYTITMMEKCENILDKSMKALVNQDIDLAKAAIKDDKVINKLRENIKTSSIELIVLRQPVAKDLRYVYALDKICIELERVGDYVKNISRDQIEIGDNYIENIDDLVRISIVCKNMISDCKVAISKKNTKLSYDIGARDEEIDNLYKALVAKTIEEMKNHPEKIEQNVRVLFIARYLERIGDHIVNVCENLIYAVDGDMVSM